MEYGGNAGTLHELTGTITERRLQERLILPFIHF